MAVLIAAAVLSSVGAGATAFGPEAAASSGGYSARSCSSVAVSSWTSITWSQSGREARITSQSSRADRVISGSGSSVVVGLETAMTAYGSGLKIAAIGWGGAVKTGYGLSKSGGVALSGSSATHSLGGIDIIGSGRIGVEVRVTATARLANGHIQTCTPTVYRYAA